MNWERVQVYLEVLACPLCKGELLYVEKQELKGFVCKRCALLYPILDDIPNMLPEEAIPFRDESSEGS